MKRSKRYKAIFEKCDNDKRYTVDEALNFVVESATTKFNESIDVAVNLGIDAKQSDQHVRGAVVLPHGLGKEVRVVVFAKGPKEDEAKNAGADFVGAEDIVEKIKNGWLDFDKCIATPDMMASVAKVAKILGPRGLMPNPKVGTVTFEVGKAVEIEKRGKLDFKIDKAGIVHATFGKKDMGVEKLKGNFLAFLGAIIKAKPASSKGSYLRAMTLSSTMGLGVKLDVNRAQGEVS